MLSQAIDAALRGRAGRDFRDDKREYPLAELSRSQLAVLQMVALGMSNAEIATEAGGNPRVNAAREFIRIAGLPHGK